MDVEGFKAREGMCGNRVVGLWVHALIQCVHLKQVGSPKFKIGWGQDVKYENQLNWTSESIWTSNAILVEAGKKEEKEGERERNFILQNALSLSLNSVFFKPWEG